MAHFDWKVRSLDTGRSYKRRDTLHGIKCHATQTFVGQNIAVELGGNIYAVKLIRDGKWDVFG